MQRDLRPAFAGFYLDLQDILSSTNADWADDLRDALGLYHFNPLPPVRELTVLVFQYPIRSVPHFLSDTKARPLVPPTVLDSRPNPAFCPVPAGSLTGHTVHLSQNVPPLMREVLHPPVALQAVSPVSDRRDPQTSASCYPEREPSMASGSRAGSEPASGLRPTD